MATTQLYLIRHGETEENVAGILQGHLPGRLTARGRQQAITLAEDLSDSGFDALVASDLARASETARLMGERWGMKAELTPLLRERDWGSLTGRPAKGVDSRHLPSDTESIDDMAARAAQFLHWAVSHYEGQRVAVVTHGLFARCIQAVASGLTIGEVPRMANTEVRRLDITDAPTDSGRGVVVSGPDVVSAN